MPKITDKPLVRVHPRIFLEDHETLMKIYGKNIGESEAIRRIIHFYVKENEAHLRSLIDKVEGSLT